MAEEKKGDKSLSIESYKKQFGENSNYFEAKPLSTRDHDSSEIHHIGGALPVPSVCNDTLGQNALLTNSYVGASPIPAREDHIHLWRGYTIGDVNIQPPGVLYFGSAPRQMINLYGTAYGIGVQANTLYNRSNQNFAWYKGGVHADPELDPGAGGVEMACLTVGGILHIGRGIKPASALNLYGTGDTCFIEFFSDTTRKGYVGVNAGYATLAGEVNQAVRLWSNGGYARIQATDYIEFYSGGSHSARFGSSGDFVLGKTTAAIATAGIAMLNAAAGAAYSIQNTMDSNNPNIICNKIAPGIVSAVPFIDFRLTNVTIGSIGRNAATSAVLYNTTSDYRLKEDLGPINRPIERIKLLRPIKARFHSDAEGQVVETFMAHEVSEVVPLAVTGEKDAVELEDDEERGVTKGDIIPQQMDNSKLIPLLVAAVQELTKEVETLRAEVNQLKAA